MSKECTGAGIICFFDNRGIKQRYVSGLDKDILYLCLETHDMSIDFPKGGRDFGEHPLDCATRETFEEINLSTDDDWAKSALDNTTIMQGNLYSRKSKI